MALEQVSMSAMMAGRQEEVRIVPRESVCTSFERETLLRLEVDERQGVVKETHGGF